MILRNWGVFIDSIYYWLYQQEIREVSVGYATVRIIFRAVGTIMLIFVIPLIFYMIIKKKVKKSRDNIVESHLLLCRIVLVSFLEILIIFLFSKKYIAGQQVRYFLF